MSGLCSMSRSDRILADLFKLANVAAKVVNNVVEPLTLSEILDDDNDVHNLSNSLPDCHDVTTTTESLEQQASRAFYISSIPRVKTNVAKTKVNDGIRKTKAAPRWHQRFKRAQHKLKVQDAARKAFFESMKNTFSQD